MLSVQDNRKAKKAIKLFIDLNCDLAQSFGVYKNESEKELLSYVSSVNIACGAHAGDPLTIKQALETARDKNLHIGAHVGHYDIQGFGYREINLEADELEALISYQLGAISSLAKAYGLKVEHVRPHGALYKQAAQEEKVALAIAKAMEKFDPWLIYVGANSSTLEAVKNETSIRVAREILLDKTYNTDGSVDFNKNDITSEHYSFNMLENLIKNSSVFNNNEGKTKVDFETIHLNLKSPFSIKLAKRALDLIQTPTPLGATLIKETGWIE